MVSLKGFSATRLGKNNLKTGVMGAKEKLCTHLRLRHLLSSHIKIRQLRTRAILTTSLVIHHTSNLIENTAPPSTQSPHTEFITWASRPELSEIYNDAEFCMQSHSLARCFIQIPHTHNISFRPVTYCTSSVCSVRHPAQSPCARIHSAAATHQHLNTGHKRATHRAKQPTLFHCLLHS
jgi:hypothetical protein